MDTFLTAWLPNIVCSLVFGGLGWLFGRESARDAREKMELQLQILKSLALAAEEGGALKLARDAHGDITGGRVLSLKTGSDSIAVSGQLVGGTLTYATPASPTGGRFKRVLGAAQPVTPQAAAQARHSKGSGIWSPLSIRLTWR